MKLKIYYVLVFCFLVALANAELTYAKEIDFQTDVIFDKRPIASFALLDNNDVLGYANDNFYDASLYDFDLTPNCIKVKLGKELNFKDLSVPSSGENLASWDVQIYPPNEVGQIMLFNNLKDVNGLKINFSKEGVWDIYLCVSDTSESKNGIENVSINGNHRWLGKSKELENTYFWWYFVQLRVIVEKEEGKVEDDELEHDLIVNDDSDTYVIEHSPETEIFSPDILYPIELTDSKKYFNKITWDYYDEDDDEIIDAGYRLYHFLDGKKILLREANSLTLRSQRSIFLTGEMNEKFLLEVWVKDVTDRYGYDSKVLTIDKIVPNIMLAGPKRVYIDDYIILQLNEDFDDKNQYLSYYFKDWYVRDEFQNKVLVGEGKIPNSLFIDEDKFQKNSNYELVQRIYFKENLYEVKISVFVVEVLEPTVELKSVSNCFGTWVDIDKNIFQKQSIFKGELDDCYVDYLSLANYYTICDRSKVEVYRGKGIVSEICLDGTFGISNAHNRSVYELRQYVVNNRNVVGVGSCLVEVDSSMQVDMKLLIKERDDDPTTISNQIYFGEKVELETVTGINMKNVLRSYYSIVDERGYEVLKRDGVLNGLYDFKLTSGKYFITQYLDINDGKTLESSVTLVVNDIKEPIVILRNYNNKSYSYLEDIDFYFDVMDVNKSEEHPNGYLLNTNYKVDSVSYIGIFDGISAGRLQKNCKHYVCQVAINAEHPDIYSLCNCELDIYNLCPVISLNVDDLVFVGDEFEGSIIIEDLDGIVSDYEYCFANQKIAVIDRKIENYGSTVKINLKLKAISEGIEFFQVNCKDDDGERTMLENYIQVVYSEVPIDFYIYEEESRDYRVDRYFKWLAFSESSNEIELEYLVPGSNKYVKIINNLQVENNLFYEDEFVKGCYDVQEGDRLEFSMYFKKDGEYKFRARGLNYPKVGMWKVKELSIEKDLVPKIDLKLKKEYVRQMPSKKFLISGDIDYECESSNSEITIFLSKDSQFLKDEISIKVDVDTNEQRFEYETKENDLGKYYIKSSIKKLIEQLPNENHVLYSEIISKCKIGFSNIYEVDLINVKPFLSFEVSGYNYKIIQYEER